MDTDQMKNKSAHFKKKLWNWDNGNIFHPVVSFQKCGSYLIQENPSCTFTHPWKSELGHLDTGPSKGLGFNDLLTAAGLNPAFKVLSFPL